jgi:hypothetical protein
MARIMGDDASAITQAGISSIVLNVFKNDSTTAEITSTVTISTSVFDTYQTDARWSKDSTGYNFRHQIPFTVMDTGDATYRCEYKFVPSSGNPWFVVYLIDTVEIRAS